VLEDWHETTVLGTDPLVADSDGDGVLDGEELAAGGDPLDHPYAIVDFISYAFDGTVDADQPGAPSLAEIDPLAPSSDSSANVFGGIHTVYPFGGNAPPPAEQVGLQLDTSNRITAPAYNVELVFEVDAGAGSFRRVFDAKDRLSDFGAYIEPSGHFTGHPAPSDLGGTLWPSATFQRLVLVKETNGDASLCHECALVASGPDVRALTIDGGRAGPRGIESPRRPRGTDAVPAHEISTCSTRSDSSFQHQILCAPVLQQHRLVDHVVLPRHAAGHL